MLIFGYDEMINNKPITNGFKFIGEKSPINLGFAGYKIAPDTTDKEINDFDLTKKIKVHETHYNRIRHFFDIKLKQVGQIKEKYFYVIDIFSHDFWKDENAKNISISQQAITDIKNKKAKLLVLFISESFENYHNVISIIESWILKYDLPKQSVIVGNGNYKTYKQHQFIKFISYSVWENYYYNGVYKSNKKAIETLKQEIIKRKIREKVFLNYNRRLRHHRSKFVYDLKKKNIFEYGFVSLGSPPAEDINKEYFNGNIPLSFFDELPITFDNTDLNINHVDELILKDFSNSYFSVVSETSVKMDDLFPSEKIWKVITGLHPFMVVAAPGFLNMLQRLGYKTFTRWIDESYDNEKDLDIRIDMITNEVKKLTLKTKEELTDMLVNMLPTLEYNLNHFIQRGSSKEFQKQLEIELSS